MSQQTLEKPTTQQQPASKPAPAQPPAQAHAPAATPKPAFTMPNVTIGLTVLWYEHGVRSSESPPRPAIVVKKNQTNVALNVIDADSDRFRLKEIVRHIDDPGTKSDELLDDGAWDFTEETKAIRKYFAANNGS